MKKLTAAVITALMIISAAPSVMAVETDDISALSAVLIDGSSGRVIWGKAENTRRPMASTTKIMSALIALESGNLDEEFTVDPVAVRTEGSSMGLCEGDIVSLRDLCIGMLLPSGNDAANCTAVRISGSTEDFAQLMNSRAREIGLHSTHFVTPSGLHDDNHYSTAYDMSLLAAYALDNPDFAQICSSRYMGLDFGNPPYKRTLTNTNKLLSLYDNCIGVKTGFTDEAGRCLVSAAEKNGIRLICVTLNAPDDWNDHIKLYDYGFSCTSKREYDTPVEWDIRLAGGTEEYVHTAAAEKVTYTSVKGNADDITVKITVPPMLYAPVSEGTQVGEAVIYNCGREIDRIPMITTQSCAVKTGKPHNDSLFDRAVDWFKQFF